MTKQELLNELESTIRHEVKASIITEWKDATNVCFTFCKLVSDLELLNKDEHFTNLLDNAYQLKNDLCRELNVPDGDIKIDLEEK